MRLGLSFEGIFRQATVLRGRNRDTAWYAAIDTNGRPCASLPEWLALANFDVTATAYPPVRLTQPILKHGG
jgi:hypothetical protein